MKDLTDIDLEFNRNAICPYCSYENLDSWELHMNDGDEENTDCKKCGKEFKVSCTITVTYSTEKLGDEK